MGDFGSATSSILKIGNELLLQLPTLVRVHRQGHAPAIHCAVLVTVGVYTAGGHTTCFRVYNMLHPFQRNSAKLSQLAMLTRKRRSSLSFTKHGQEVQRGGRGHVASSPSAAGSEEKEGTRCSCLLVSACWQQSSCRTRPSNMGD